jgi:hypothetical protein
MLGLAPGLFIPGDIWPEEYTPPAPPVPAAWFDVATRSAVFAAPRRPSAVFDATSRPTTFAAVAQI